MNRQTMRTKLFLAGLFSFFFGTAPAQVFISPAVGLKSHETMDILSVEVAPENTVITVSVENRRNDGTFCADRNIFIIYPDGTRSKLVRASGIPQCPDTYKFKSIGEKLQFTLVFRSAVQGAGWITLLEECNDNCFSVYGILLNNGLTGRIAKALSNIDKDKIDTAIGDYRDIIASTGERDAGITGSLYSDLITLLVRQGYTAQASDWYKRLGSSSLPQKEMYINNLNSRGIKF